MNYLEYQPAAPLAPWIRCFWRLTDSLHPSNNSTDPKPNPQPEIVVPDGCCEIIINAGDPFKKHIDNTWTKQPRILIAGQLTNCLTIRPTGVIDLLGIRFRPAGFAALSKNTSVSDFRNQQVSLNSLSTRLQTELHDAFHNSLPKSRAPQNLLARIQCVLLRHIQPSPRETHTQRAVLAINQTRGQIRLAHLATRLRISQRQLERRFRSDVGLTPIAYTRIIRFQNLLNAIPSNVPPNWSTLAITHGYFDQAHMICDFRKFSGLSPNAYLRTHHPMSDCLTTSTVSDFSNTT